jgi:exoribonuclease-2
MDLARIATRAMLERDLEPEFPVKALLQLKSLSGPSAESTSDIVDLTHLLWCSLDNDDSRDLDQLTVCTQENDGNTLILVAVADVDALIKQDCPIDLHARKNTASIYTCAKVFPMLPERLSTDWTSLNPNENRIALVTEMRISSAGVITSTRIFRAKVRNKAKLAYDSVSSWIEGKADMPSGIASVPGLAQQIEAQDRVAQMLRSKRFEAGALQFENFQPKAIFRGDLVIKIEQQAQNRARQLIEEFMIATNKSIADFLLIISYIKNHPLKILIDEYNHRFEVLADEIANMKDIVLKLQTYTMEVNKTLMDERIHVFSDLGNNQQNDFNNLVLDNVNVDSTESTSIDLRNLVKEEFLNE